MNKKLWMCLILIAVIPTAMLSIGWGNKTRTTDDLAKIAAVGGGLVLDAGGKDVNDLMKIAALSSTGGGTLHLKNCGGMDTDDLVKIAAAGGGHVLIEF